MSTKKILPLILFLTFILGCVGNERERSSGGGVIELGAKMKPSLSDTRFVEVIELALIVDHKLTFKKVTEGEASFYKIQISENPQDMDDLRSDLDNYKNEVEIYLDYYPENQYAVPGRKNFLEKLKAIKVFLDSFDSSPPTPEDEV